MPRDKIYVGYYCERWALCDLADEVGLAPHVARRRYALINRPEDITGHDDLLAPVGHYRRATLVVVDGELMTVLEAADRYLTTKQTVTRKMRQYGRNLTREHLVVRQGQRTDLIRRDVGNSAGRHV